MESNTVKLCVCVCVCVCVIILSHIKSDNINWVITLSNDTSFINRDCIKRPSLQICIKKNLAFKFKSISKIKNWTAFQVCCWLSKFNYSLAFVIFWPKNIGTKASYKMLMKLTKGVNFNKIWLTVPQYPFAKKKFCTQSTQKECSILLYKKRMFKKCRWNWL